MIKITGVVPLAGSSLNGQAVITRVAAPPRRGAGCQRSGQTVQGQPFLTRTVAQKAPVAAIAVPAKSPTSEPIVQGPLVGASSALNGPVSAKMARTAPSAPPFLTGAEAVTLVKMARLRPAERLRALVLRSGRVSSVAVFLGLSSRPPPPFYTPYGVAAVPREVPLASPFGPGSIAVLKG